MSCEERNVWLASLNELSEQILPGCYKAEADELGDNFCRIVDADDGEEMIGGITYSEAKDWLLERQARLQTIHFYVH